ncbi:MAG: alpha/beta hydrolase [Oscillospiraceae bacterium]|nr:alpha/beta hydrolase [Oscillospiraceae bacterium]
MAISTKFVRMQLEILKPFLAGFSIKTERMGTATIGNLMAGTHKRMVNYLPTAFENFTAEFIVPKSLKRSGVILYLHGGGYVTGDINYAKGFGTIIAAKNNIKVFCIAYRLAPEDRFPAALEDAFSAYKYLLDSGYRNDEIILCGESAGGGLIYSLCLKIKELNLPLPCGIIAISPWTDLTSSGKSYDYNINNDPSITKERLNFFASSYTDDFNNPLVSPLFGELKGMPPSLIFVGGDEIMLDDSIELHNKLLKSGSKSELIITPKMWHGYMLYGIKETKKDHEKMAEFITEALYERS